MNNSPPIISFFNNKGGVGKTTLVYHLAWMFAGKGQRVLVADLDPQSNLTAMFFGDDVESLWNDDEVDRTIMQSIRPVVKGIGDILPAHVEAFNEHIGIIPGNLQLSTFEDQLSESWIKCSDGQEAAFRVVSAFYRIIINAARDFEATCILVDVGPNLGAINRAALIASDYFITPVSPDLYSVQGLKNLGPTLRNWQNQWKYRLKQNPEPSLQLPEGNMHPAGYIVLQHTARSDRPVKAYRRWADRIPLIYRQHVLNQTSGSAPASAEEDEFCLGLLKHYQSLIPMAMEVNKPIFQLKPADGAIGSHVDAVRKSYADFDQLARQIARVCDIEMVADEV